MKKPVARLVVAFAAAAFASCVGASKSSNPLSPDIAGPIAGVSVSAPKEVAPAVGAQIDTNAQPIMLQVQNATSNGPRPLKYLFEVATDPGFTNKVTSLAVPQDSSGRTSVKLPVLAPDRTYYWHAAADDGAESGPFTLPIAFTVFTPIVIGPPSLLSPISNATVGSQPTFKIGNASRSGPVGALSYSVEVADSASFGHLVATYTMGEGGGGQSSVVATSALSPATYYWRARAFDPKNNGPYSSIASFIVSASGGGGGGGSGSGSGSCSQTRSEADWRQYILAAASGINPESSNAMLTLQNKLRGQGCAVSVLNKDGAPSDHKAWLNGIGWSWISSNNFQSGTYRWDPYIQVPYDGGGYSSCGIPNSQNTACPPW